MQIKVIVLTALTATVFASGAFGASRTAGNESGLIEYPAIASKEEKQLFFRGGKNMLTESDEVILFDFVSDDAVSAWSVVNDTVMGGLSSSQMEKSKDGKGVFFGNVSLENNGGFSSVRSPRMQHSLAEFAGIVLLVKGDGKRYKCGLRTDDLFDGVSHQAPFATKSGEWQLVMIPFTDFVPTYHGRRLSEDKRMKREAIQRMSFLIADKQMGPFRLEIDWIRAYR